MGLNHFGQRHYKAKHFTTVRGLIGAVVAGVSDWIIRARRRLRR